MLVGSDLASTLGWFSGGGHFVELPSFCCNVSYSKSTGSVSSSLSHASDLH